MQRKADPGATIPPAVVRKLNQLGTLHTEKPPRRASPQEACQLTHVGLRVTDCDGKVKAEFAEYFRQDKDGYPEIDDSGLPITHAFPCLVAAGDLREKLVMRRTTNAMHVDDIDANRYLCVGGKFVVRTGNVAIEREGVSTHIVYEHDEDTYRTLAAKGLCEDEPFLGHSRCDYLHTDPGSEKLLLNAYGAPVMKQHPVEHLTNFVEREQLVLHVEESPFVHKNGRYVLQERYRHLGINEEKVLLRDNFTPVTPEERDMHAKLPQQEMVFFIPSEVFEATRQLGSAKQVTNKTHIAYIQVFMVFVRMFKNPAWGFCDPLKAQKVVSRNKNPGPSPPCGVSMRETQHRALEFGYHNVKGKNVDCVGILLFLQSFTPKYDFSMAMQQALCQPDPMTIADLVDIRIHPSFRQCLINTARTAMDPVDGFEKFTSALRLIYGTADRLDLDTLDKVSCFFDQKGYKAAVARNDKVKDEADKIPLSEFQRTYTHASPLRFFSYARCQVQFSISPERAPDVMYTEEVGGDYVPEEDGSVNHVSMRLEGFKLFPDRGLSAADYLRVKLMWNQMDYELLDSKLNLNKLSSEGTHMARIMETWGILGSHSNEKVDSASCNDSDDFRDIKRHLVHSRMREGRQREAHEIVDFYLANPTDVDTFPGLAALRESMRQVAGDQVQHGVVTKHLTCLPHAEKLQYAFVEVEKKLLSFDTRVAEYDPSHSPMRGHYSSFLFYLFKSVWKLSGLQRFGYLACIFHVMTFFRDTTLQLNLLLVGPAAIGKTEFMRRIEDFFGSLVKKNQAKSAKAMYNDIDKNGEMEICEEQPAFFRNQEEKHPQKAMLQNFFSCDRNDEDGNGGRKLSTLVAKLQTTRIYIQNTPLNVVKNHNGFYEAQDKPLTERFLCICVPFSEKLAYGENKTRRTYDELGAVENDTTYNEYRFSGMKLFYLATQVERAYLLGAFDTLGEGGIMRDFSFGFDMFEHLVNMMDLGQVPQCYGHNFRSRSRMSKYFKDICKGLMLERFVVEHFTCNAEEVRIWRKNNTAYFGLCSLNNEAVLSANAVNVPKRLRQLQKKYQEAVETDSNDKWLAVCQEALNPHGGGADIPGVPALRKVCTARLGGEPVPDDDSEYEKIFGQAGASLVARVAEGTPVPQTVMRKFFDLCCDNGLRAFLWGGAGFKKRCQQLLHEAKCAVARVENARPPEEDPEWGQVMHGRVEEMDRRFTQLCHAACEEKFGLEVTGNGSACRHMQQLLAIQSDSQSMHEEFEDTEEQLDTMARFLDLDSCDRAEREVRYLAVFNLCLEVAIEEFATNAARLVGRAVELEKISESLAMGERAPKYDTRMFATEERAMIQGFLQSTLDVKCMNMERLLKHRAELHVTEEDVVRAFSMGIEKFFPSRIYEVALLVGQVGQGINDVVRTTVQGAEGEVYKVDLAAHCPEGVSVGALKGPIALGSWVDACGKYQHLQFAEDETKLEAFVSYTKQYSKMEDLRIYNYRETPRMVSLMQMDADTLFINKEFVDFCNSDHMKQQEVIYGNDALHCDFLEKLLLHTTRDVPIPLNGRNSGVTDSNDAPNQRHDMFITLQKGQRRIGKAMSAMRQNNTEMVGWKPMVTVPVGENSVATPREAPDFARRAHCERNHIPYTPVECVPSVNCEEDDACSESAGYSDDGSDVWGQDDEWSDASALDITWDAMQTGKRRKRLIDA